MIGKILGNRYEIIEKIGGGGMALVYKAKCQLLNRYVAVKILRPEFTSDEEFITKFKRESQSAASLSHPNIVNIYDVGNDEDDIYYIVMEYVKGKTLKQIIREEGPLEPEKIINIAKQITLALQHAHNNHIVHRDIKPHNILITEDGRVKVTDFGIARAVTSSTVTNTGNVIGSVHYFSPEQARGGYIDEKSDIYSLGIVIYEMATGKVPFEGESPISIALKHINEDVVLPSTINPNIPKAIEDIILKAVQKDQVKRYASAKEMLEDLNQALKYPMGNFVKYQDDEDSPTQVIPVIKDEDIKPKNIKAKSPKEIESKPKKKKDKWIMWGAIVSGFVLALLFIGGIFYFKDAFIAQEKEVPNVVGLSFEEAKSNLENLGFKVEVASKEYSSEYEKDHVISQDPSTGDTRKSGYSIKLVISKGARLVETPDLVDKNLDEIDTILEDAGLREGIVKYEYSSLPDGTIISQDPRAFEEVDEGTKVNLVVSKGPEVKMVSMPNLVGEDINTAKKIINNAGLILGNIQYRFDNQDKGTVISQSISSGTQVQEKKIVDVVVSKGSEEPVEEPQVRPFSFKLNYDKAQNDEFQLKVVKVQDGVSTQVYSGVHNKENSEKERITIQGSGKATIQIYFDDELITSKKVDFETGKLYD